MLGQNLYKHVRPGILTHHRLQKSLGPLATILQNPIPRASLSDSGGMAKKTLEFMFARVYESRTSTSEKPVLSNFSQVTNSLILEY